MSISGGAIKDPRSTFYEITLSLDAGRCGEGDRAG